MPFFRAHVLVCAGTNCHLKGSSNLRELLQEEIKRGGLADEVRVVETGCFGLCEQGPTLVIYPEGTFYTRVQPEDIPVVVTEHLMKGRIVTRLLYRDSGAIKPVTAYDRTNFFQKQKRVVLRNCGLINPESIDEYIARGGYEALGRVLTAMSAEDVIREIKASGLRGRGGAGFPTGVKWEYARRTPGDEKYLICNADEGEPGTFKDRLILEGDPHSILEGMAIAAYAIGAHVAYVYVRGEYKLSVARLEKAITDAKRLGLLGENVFGSRFCLEVRVVSGAGAYVCGEETALIESIEGNRGEPRYKPPYPASFGLFGKPTVVNNVETLANIAEIMDHGAAWFRGIGTDKSPGTKVYTLTGNVINTGLIEVPMGITLRELIFEIGGGIPGGRGFKMAQTGGTSGGCLAVEHLDLPMDYDSLQSHGSALGSGALLIMDDRHCIVDITRNFLKFFKHESCGQCTPCREGTTQLYRLVTRITEGKSSPQDIELINRLSRTMQSSSLCALGQTAPVPVLSTLRYFGEEYRRHIEDHVCPAGVCHLCGGRGGR
jgi:NADH:ubiquinone oxidoreductase subunit F (NADH-binding)/(2Fe-2S) ferredoxin